MKATTLLVRQHQRIAMLLDAVERERYVRAPLFEELVEELTAHLGAEDLLRYPAAPERVRDLATRTGDDRESFLRALQALTSADATTPDFGRTLAAFVAEFRRHVDLEECHLIPAIERAASEQELVEFGARMEQFCAEIVAAWREVVGERPPRGAGA
jgi:hypothetical protein